MSEEDKAPDTDPRQKPLQGLEEEPASKISPRLVWGPVVLAVFAVIFIAGDRMATAAVFGVAAVLLWLYALSKRKGERRK